MREPFLTWNALIAPQNKAAMARAKAHWDGVAKPLDGLGKLETAVVRIAGVTGDENVSIDRRTVLVLCAKRLLHLGIRIQYYWIKIMHKILFVSFVLFVIT